MKWPAIKMPTWWKPWYRYQVANCVFLSFNVTWALSHLDSSVVFLNWIGAGMMATLIGCNAIVFSVIDTNRALIKALDEQAEVIHALMQTNTQEIGQSIADHLNSVQRDDRPKLH